MRLTLALTAAAVLSFAAPAYGQDVVAPPAFYPNGSLAGTGLWDCFLCDVTGVRNVQGGKHTGNPQDLNLDIGAGSSVHRGHIVLNFDVGSCVHIFNGRESRIASFCPRRIVFYRRVVFR
jgi:hypothetical protein